MKDIRDLIIEENVSMKELTTYKLSGTVKYVVYPLNETALLSLVEYLNNCKIKYCILGNGSNIIFESEFYDGVIIKLTKMSTLEIDGEVVSVSAGYSLAKLVSEVANLELSGLEFASGIPGTIGGAIYMNAGAYGKSISEITEEVRVFNNGNIEIKSVTELNFGYRTSIFKENKELTILGVKLKLVKGVKNEICEIIKENTLKRKNSQPLEFPNAGSVFRNPLSIPAGKLIEELGMKGFKEGDVSVSVKHANFIINEGNASGKDIVKLINVIRDKAKKERNIDLVLEQEIIK